MPGRVNPSWCPHCRATPGLDCPDTGRTPRQVRRTETRDTARLIREETTVGTDPNPATMLTRHDQAQGMYEEDQ